MIPNEIMNEWLDNDHKTLKRVKKLLSNLPKDEDGMFAICAQCVGIIEANEISNGIIAEEFNKRYAEEQAKSALEAARMVF